MPRFKISHLLLVLGVVALFVLFIAFRKDTALIGAMSAAGTVAAAAFAAVAAFASARSANESSEAARRSREAAVRAAKPLLSPSLTRATGTLQGTLTCAPGQSAIDLTAVWVLDGGEAVTQELHQLLGGTSAAVELGIPENSVITESVTAFWVTYYDADRSAKWEDTWQVGTDGHQRGTLTLTESRLVD